MRHAVVIAVALALSGCSGGTGAGEITTPPATDAVSVSASPTSSTPVSSTATSPSTAAMTSQPVAPADNSDYTEICTAAYDAGLGNAATQPRDSWIADCTAECALPANRESCDAMGAQLGID